MNRPSPLLCELHAHTSWSDGDLSPRALCDLYGQAGFDVLAITDHTTVDRHVQAAAFPRYLAEIDAEAARAHARYGLLVIPGLELTCDDPDPTRAGHAVAVGLRSFVDVGAGLEPALRAARTQGAALIAAHPDTLESAAASVRQTAAFASDPQRFAPLLDRFELFNRDTLFGWVAEAGLPAVACGDFHTLEHLHHWKTLLPCGPGERLVVDYLRSSAPAYLTRLDPDRSLQEQEAA